MSDVLPQIEPETYGRVTRLDVPVSRYLSESFSMGQDESMFRAVSNITEDKIAPPSATLGAEEANQKYGIGSLKFSAPVSESMASAMSERERTRMDKEMYLYSGATKGRFLPGMAASILGASANPLDFGSMFIPFVGEAGKIEGATRVAAILRRGLVPAESFDKIPMANKLVKSMAQGTMWMGMAEIPKMYEAHIENQPMPDVTLDLLGQAGFAAILHGAGVGMRLLGDKTHEAMTRQAMNDFMEDKPISAHQYIQLDEHVIQFQAVQRELQLRADAEQHVDFDKIKAEHIDKNLEYAVSAAIRSAPDETGQQPVHTGLAHWVIPQAFEEGAERGMWTNRGRFVTQEEAAKLHGLTEKDPTSEQLLYGTTDMGALGPEEKKVYQGLLDSGHTEPDAMAILRSSIHDRMVKSFLSRPEVQRDIEQQRQQAIDKWVEDKRQELKNPVSQEIKTAATEQTVSPKDVQRYSGDLEQMNKTLDEDLEGMGLVEDAANENDSGDLGELLQKATDLDNKYIAAIRNGTEEKLDVSKVAEAYYHYAQVLKSVDPEKAKSYEKSLLDKGQITGYKAATGVNPHIIKHMDDEGNWDEVGHWVPGKEKASDAEQFADEVTDKIHEHEANILSTQLLGLKNAKYEIKYVPDAVDAAVDCLLKKLL